HPLSTLFPYTTLFRSRTQDGAGYGAAVDARVDGPGEAARRGAIAFLLRSVGTDSHRLAHTGTTRYVDGRVPVPAFALSNPDADRSEEHTSELQSLAYL